MKNFNQTTTTHTTNTTTNTTNTTNTTKSAMAMVATALLAFSFSASAGNEVGNGVSPNKMQRYTFTYNFDKRQDRVVKLTHETQQHIAYQVINDVQASAHYAINEAGQNVALMAYQPVTRAANHEVMAD